MHFVRFIKDFLNIFVYFPISRVDFISLLLRCLFSLIRSCSQSALCAAIPWIMLFHAWSRISCIFSLDNPPMSQHWNYPKILLITFMLSSLMYKAMSNIMMIQTVQRNSSFGCCSASASSANLLWHSSCRPCTVSLTSIMSSSSGILIYHAHPMALLPISCRSFLRYKRRIHSRYATQISIRHALLSSGLSLHHNFYILFSFLIVLTFKHLFGRLGFLWLELIPIISCSCKKPSTP